MHLHRKKKSVNEFKCLFLFIRNFILTVDVSFSYQREKKKLILSISIIHLYLLIAFGTYNKYKKTVYIVLLVNNFVDCMAFH